MNNKIIVQDLFQSRKEYKNTYENLGDFLVEHYPAGFDSSIELFIDNEKFTDIDTPVNEIKIKDKYILILKTPNASLTAAVVGKWLLQLVIVSAISFAVGKIFSPNTDIPNVTDTKDRNTSSKDSSVYSLNSTQNEAKRGESIPLIYGTVRSFPPLLSPPYYKYDDNDEYLYQLMCVGHNRLFLDEMFLSDTPVTDIPGTDFQYEIVYEDSYDDLPTYDDQYVELVKTLPSPNNLEILSRENDKEYNVTFDANNHITFHPFDNGVIPDLSSVEVDDVIEISDTARNDGQKTVTAVDTVNNIITVQEATQIEPSLSDDSNAITSNTKITYAPGVACTISDIGCVVVEHYDNSIDLIEGNTYHLNVKADIYDIFLEPMGTLDISGEYVAGVVDNIGVTFPDIDFGDYLGSTYELEHIHELGIYNPDNPHCKANIFMKTSYGPYRFDETTREGKPLEYLEIDVHLPNGLYDIDDTSGDFVDRTIEFQFTLCHVDENGGLLGCVDKVESLTAKDSSPIRNSYRYSVNDIPYANQVGQYYIQIKRITPEPEGNRSQDKMYVVRVKGLYGFSDKSNWGNLTVVWAKVKATNAISSISSFQINGFFTNPITKMNDVISDLYSNNVYGAGLDPNDVIFYDVEDTDVVDVALDSKLTLMDAINTIAKPQNFYAYPYGQDLIVKKDIPQDVSTYLFNETNIIKDSLKTSYLFKDRTYDCIDAKYFDKEDMWVQKVYRYPATGMYPEVIEIPGVTNSTKIESLTHRYWNKAKHQRRSVTFESDIQGFIPNPLDKISVSEYFMNEGVAGFIDGIVDNGDGTQDITLDCLYGIKGEDGSWACNEPLVCDTSYKCRPESTDENSDFNKVMFRNRDGSVSSILDFTIVDINKIRVTNAPTWVQVYNDSDNTAFTIGTQEELQKDYLVVKILPQNNKITIEAINYDVRSYNDDP
jgi:hypothetical protein